MKAEFNWDFSPEDLEPEVVPKSDIVLNEKQQLHLDSITNDLISSKDDIFGDDSWVSLKGGAGSGKTTLSKEIVRKLLNSGFNIAVVAPTHQATKVIKNAIGFNHKKIQYASLHAFLGLKPGKMNYETGEQPFVKERNRHKLSQIALEHFDICILDESSMVSRELFGFLHEEMMQNNRIKTFLFIGDEYQLLPINEDPGKHSVYDNDKVNHYSLTELIRNTDMEVINFVTTIREMIARKATKYELFNFLNSEKDKPHNKIKFYDNKKDFFGEFIKNDKLGKSDDVIATFTNKNVDIYNTKIRNYFTKDKDGVIPEIHPKDLFVVQKTVHQEKGIIDDRKGSFINSEILVLQSTVEKEIEYKGKKFRGFVCTVKDGRKFNKIHSDSIDDLERAKELLKAQALKQKTGSAWKLYYGLENLFLDVRPQFSSTTHKLQGSSYKNVFVDMTDLSYVDDDSLLRLFYVASTRSKEDIHILI